MANRQLTSTGSFQVDLSFCPILQGTSPSDIPAYNPNTTAGTAGYHTVTTTAAFTNRIAGDLAVSALTAALPVGAMLRFENGLLVRVEAAATATDTEVTVRVIDSQVSTSVLLPSGSVAHVIQVTALTEPIAAYTRLRWSNNAITDLWCDAIDGTTILAIKPLAPGLTIAVPSGTTAKYGNGVDSPLETLSFTTGDLPFNETINATATLLHSDSSQTEIQTPTSQTRTINCTSAFMPDDHGLATMENIARDQVQQGRQVYIVYQNRVRYVEAIGIFSNLNTPTNTGDIVQRTFDLMFSGPLIKDLSKQKTWAVA